MSYLGHSFAGWRWDLQLTYSSAEPTVKWTVQSPVESYQSHIKRYLIPPQLSIIKYGLRAKWNNPGKGVVSFPTSRCSSYWKGSLRVTLDYGRQLYFYLYFTRFRYRAIGLMSRVFANGPGGSIPGRVIPKTQKMVLDTTLLSTQHYKVRIKG